MTAATATSALPVLLTQAQVSEATGLPEASLKSERTRGTGLPYVKFGRRVRYRADDVAAYIAANTVMPGASPPQQD
ncbi:helix-turn-helix transcriptional regulator [Mycobacterium intracellulare]|uniref:helix-turn-helix transcriptional regulator n=1 Tax=Mycobacterium intracellulare TaxID=1767 RepID=UPI0035DE4FB2|nr:helix-turn-helix domain-containing protein [Mycobacterium intracellulare]